MIKVRFLGVARLKWGLKECALDRGPAISLDQLTRLLSEGRPPELGEHLREQAYSIIDLQGKERLLRMPQDLRTEISDGSMVTVVTPLTGG